MDRARSWNSIAFHPSIPFIPRQKSSIVPVQENTRANLDFPFPFFLLLSREISPLKYSTRERLYPLRNLSMEYSKRSRCNARDRDRARVLYPLETWWLETSRCWRDVHSSTLVENRSISSCRAKCLESKNNISRSWTPPPKRSTPDCRGRVETQGGFWNYVLV